MRLASRILLGAVFCASAISKLFFMESFELYIFSFGFFGFDLCSLAARVLCCLELMMGSLMMTGIFRRLLNYSCATFLGLFSVFLLWRMVAGDDSSCHCFGEVLKMNPGQSLVKNALLALLLLGGWKAPSRDLADLIISHAARLKKTVASCIIAVVVCAAVFIPVFCALPPSFYLRRFIDSNDLAVENWAQYSQQYGLSEGPQTVLFLSPVCEHCRHTLSKVNSIVNRHGLATDRIHLVFMGVSEDEAAMSQVLSEFYKNAALDDSVFGKGEVDTHVIPFEEFIPLTDGVIPIVCLFKDGELLKEWSYNSVVEDQLVRHLLSGEESHNNGEQ